MSRDRDADAMNDGPRPHRDIFRGMPEEGFDLLSEFRSLVAEFNAALRASLADIDSLAEEQVRQSEYQDTLSDERQHYLDLFDAAPDGYLVTDMVGVIIQANQTAATLLNVAPADLPGKPFTIFVPVQFRATCRSEMRRVEREGVTESWSLILQPRRAAPFPVDITLAPFVDQLDGSRGLRWLVRNASDRVRAENQLKIRVRQQAAVAELGQMALPEANPADVMKRASELIAETMNVDFVGVMERVPGRDELVLKEGVGWGEGVVGSATVPAGTGSHAGFTLLGRKPVIVTNTRMETRFGMSPLHKSHDVASALSAVIMGRHEPIGVLGAGTSWPRRFTNEDVNFLQSVANVIAGAMELRRARDEVREFAVKEERNRLAREMHDSLMQDLAGIGFMLGGLEGSLRKAGADDEIVSTVMAVQEVARRSIREARRSIWNLRSGLFEHECLPDVLKSMIDSTKDRSGLSCSFTSTGAPRPVSPDKETTILRICQEAMGNAIKHASANCVDVCLDFEDSVISLTVSDDGVGFEVDAVSERSGRASFGLTSMRERAELVGGELLLDSRPGAGTKVVLKVPADPAAASESG
ncbi:MAG: histidine kinase [Dehalococcoidia bacterium]